MVVCSAHIGARALCAKRTWYPFLSHRAPRVCEISLVITLFVARALISMISALTTPVVVVERPQSERLTILNEEYGNVSIQHLLSSTRRLERKLGAEKTAKVVGLIEQGKRHYTQKGCISGVASLNLTQRAQRAELARYELCDAITVRGATSAQGEARPICAPLAELFRWTSAGSQAAQRARWCIYLIVIRTAVASY